MCCLVSGLSNCKLRSMSFPKDIDTASRRVDISANNKFASGSSSCGRNEIWITREWALGRSIPTFQFAESIGRVRKISTPYKQRVPRPVPLYASIINSSQESAAFSLTSSTQIGMVVWLAALNKYDGVVWLLH